MDIMVHGVPLNIPWNSIGFHGTFASPIQISPSYVELRGIRRAPLQTTQRFHGFLWNFGATKSNTTEFCGIPWNLDIVILIYITWASMQYPMEFHGTFQSPYLMPPSSIIVYLFNTNGMMLSYSPKIRRLFHFPDKCSKQYNASATDWQI